MHGWLSRFFRSRPRVGVRRYRPAVEGLETRYVPTGPSIINLALVNVSGNTFAVSGDVLDPSPGNVSVNLTGVLSGSVSTSAAGAFKFVGQASGPGSFAATATDQWSNSSSAVSGVVDGPPSTSNSGTPEAAAPSIAVLVAVGTNGGMVQVMGIVEVANPRTVAVNFSGLITGTAVPDADGVFTITAEPTGSGQITAQAVDQWNQTASASCSVLDPSGGGPKITNMRVANTSGTIVQITGTVVDAAPDSATVAFGGVLSGSTTPAADGSFSFTGQASGLGGFTAQVTNSQQVQSATVVGEVTSNSPFVTDFVAQHLSGSVWEFSGHVADSSPATCDVEFMCSASWNGTTITLNSDGTFALIATLPSNNPSEVSVLAQNAWGLNSSVVVCQEINGYIGSGLGIVAPVITSFTASLGSGNTWTLSGQVSDNSAGVSVWFFGLPAVNGQSTNANSSGSFQLSVTIGQGQTGMISALAVNSWSLTSDFAYIIL